MMSVTCVNCGVNENHGGLFCRSCGAELQRAVAPLPETRRETVTAFASPPLVLDARSEIARAVAYKITQLDNNPKDLKKLAEDVLPELEKFLESPAEKRLRRMRAGIITAATGLGLTLFFLMMGAIITDVMTPVAAIGVMLFFIGVGLFINGKWLTVNKLEQPALNQMPDAVSEFLNRPYEGVTPVYPVSVTENTTHRLGVPQPLAAKVNTNRL